MGVYSCIIEVTCFPFRAPPPFSMKSNQCLLLHIEYAFTRDVFKKAPMNLCNLGFIYDLLFEALMMGVGPENCLTSLLIVFSRTLWMACFCLQMKYGANTLLYSLQSSCGRKNFLSYCSDYCACAMKWMRSSMQLQISLLRDKLYCTPAFCLHSSQTDSSSMSFSLCFTIEFESNNLVV